MPDQSAAAMLPGATPDLDSLDLVRRENTSQETMLKLIDAGTKETYSHDEMFGRFCTITEYVEVPYDLVFDYCADTLFLQEWTYSVRDLAPIGGEVYRGWDAIQPNTEIYMRTQSLKGLDYGVVVYECAWDQGDELWMRYHLTIVNSEKPLGKPGTIISWTNCKHPYYDRNVVDVPDYITDGRARTDRLWVGDIWPVFHSGHWIEMNNLTKILKHRFESR